MGPASPETQQSTAVNMLVLDISLARGDVLREKIMLALQLRSSRGSWHCAHPKGRVEFILGYEQLFFKVSLFFFFLNPLLRMELLSEQTATPGDHLSYRALLQFHFLATRA